MKKKVIALFVVCFMFAFMQQYFKRSSELSCIIDSALTSIESLAQDEFEADSWQQPETKRCMLQLGGGWFTSSVERICVFCAVPYSCTPVECGEVF
ncbi:hypothetical protein [uncultured Bacteroides sp.]|jgi:hypothetical protein|uniref:hypothetical protein n=1 Tax=uncultured Bacteroides sp. TaxID=162156 RepID=UPI0023D5809F|nr:hypothetical protein [uncultured Bacteroides sp.]MDE5701184.1 hypothetical protein [Bacteroides sp.]